MIFRRRAALVSVLAALLVACAEEPAPPERAPNVLLVTVDTLRKDRLHLYGYEKQTSRHLNALGAAGWVFDRHVAHASQTVPSTLSMMLSRYPVDHGFVHRKAGQFHDRPPLYPPELEFLAEVFAGAGYETAAVVSNFFVSAKVGFEQGFDTFEWGGPAPSLTARAIGWLEGWSARGRTAPFFLYLHYFDPHHPYDAPPRYQEQMGAPPEGSFPYRNGPADLTPEQLAYASGHYDATLPFVDDQIGRVIGWIDAQGLDPDTVVVVTADHGEEFLDHGGLGHGTTLFAELVDVPLVIRYPKLLAPGRRVAHLTRHLDLAPTLLGFAGIPVPAGYEGGSLLEPAERSFADDGPWRAVVVPDWKLVWHVESDVWKAYRRDDRGDRNPIDPPPELAPLMDALRDYASREPGAGTPAPANHRWTEAEKTQLRALGYAE